MRENENEMAADAATPLTDAELEQVTGGAGSLTSLITTERRFIETFRFESSALSFDRKHPLGPGWARLPARASDPGARAPLRRRLRRTAPCSRPLSRVEAPCSAQALARPESAPTDPGAPGSARGPASTDPRLPVRRRLTRARAPRRARRA